MKKFPKIILIACALAPILGFFPVELHYALMWIVGFFRLQDPSQFTVIQKPGGSYYLLQLLEHGLSFHTAAIFFGGVFWLRHLVHHCVDLRQFYLIWGLYFVSALSYLLTPNLLPFFFAIAILALLMNVRAIWAMNGKSD